MPAPGPSTTLRKTQQCWQAPFQAHFSANPIVEQDRTLPTLNCQQLVTRVSMVPAAVPLHQGWGLSSLQQLQIRKSEL